MSKKGKGNGKGEGFSLKRKPVSGTGMYKNRKAAAKRKGRKGLGGV
jgi:hypothetical protein